MQPFVAGLVAAPYFIVDDTGARHANRNIHTTHIGGEHFCAIRISTLPATVWHIAPAWCDRRQAEAVDVPAPRGHQALRVHLQDQED